MSRFVALAPVVFGRAGDRILAEPRLVRVNPLTVATIDKHMGATRLTFSDGHELYVEGTEREVETALSAAWRRDPQQPTTTTGKEAP